MTYNICTVNLICIRNGSGQLSFINWRLRDSHLILWHFKMIYWCFLIDSWREFHEDFGQTFSRHKQSLINLRTPDQSGQIENHKIHPIHPIHPMMLWKNILYICQTVSLPKWKGYFQIFRPQNMWRHLNLTPFPSVKITF